VTSHPAYGCGVTTLDGAGAVAGTAFAFVDAVAELSPNEYLLAAAHGASTCGRVPSFRYRAMSR
jgi:hypothetical protein